MGMTAGEAASFRVRPFQPHDEAAVLELLPAAFGPWPRALQDAPRAEFFRALGEPELGALLICEADFDIASVGEGEVSLERAQTIMQGAPSCTFRYKFAPR